MRRTRKALGATAIAVIGMIGMQAAPASAATVGVASFVVEIRTSPMGTVVLLPPQQGSLSITSTIACVDLVAGKNFAIGFCNVQGAGSITGTCDLASGTIWGSLQLSSGSSVSYHINFQTEENAFEATGTVSAFGQTGTITIQGDFRPAPSGFPSTQSCLTGTQQDWILTADALWAAT